MSGMECYIQTLKNENDKNDIYGQNSIYGIVVLQCLQVT